MLEKRASAPRETSLRLQRNRIRHLTQGMTPAQQEVYERYANRRFDNQAIGFASRAAVGISPIISTVSEGAMMSAGAVVSPDRRYVRIGINANINELIDIVQFSVFGGAGNGTQAPNGN